jgi:large subunit ribosomal protein L15
MAPINLDRIQAWIDQGRLTASQPITLKELEKSGAVRGIKDGVKLLANGASSLKQPIHIIVSRASQSAIAAVEALGGTVTTRFYTPLAIVRVRTGKMHPYVSMKWDQAGLNRPALAVDGADDLVSRVKAMGFEYRLPDPSARKDIEYYRDAKNRGYLAHTVPEGESPNLYWKRVLSPEAVKALKKKSGVNVKSGAESANQLW